MLGLLPDVHVDFELKWGVTYTLHGIGVALDQDSRTVSQVLEEMETGAPVTGSKFVFDACGLTAPDFQKLCGRIGSDIRIIHLTRSYRDVFLSMARGFYHSPARAEGLSVRLRDAVATADIANAKIGPPQVVAPLICLRQLATLLDNDLQICSLRQMGAPYLQVSYDEVARRLPEIVRFAGSEAEPAAVADVLARPAVAKLPTFAGDEVVANLGELEPLLESFEILQGALITQPYPRARR